MQKSTIVLTICAILLIVLLGTLYISDTSSSNPRTSQTKTPTPAPSPSPSPLGNVYTSTSLGLSFQYPKGYFVIEDPTYDRLFIQNLNYRLTGVPNSDYRLVTVQYDNLSDSEASAKMENEVHELNVTITGAVAHLYTYPNPNNSAWTVGEAFWSTPTHTFSLSMQWNRTDGTTQTEASQELDELTLMREIVPTLSITK